MDFSRTDWAVVFATLAGPILAVQAEKFLTRRRERKEQRLRIFRTLMVTRPTKLSISHVEALNAIPIEFYGEESITKVWRLYIDHLGDKADPSAAAIWNQRADERFNAMLEVIAKSLGYKFDPVALRREHYHPNLHVEIETDQETIRRGVAELLRGKTALPMEVRGWPIDTEAAAVGRQIQAKILAWFNGEAAPTVRLDTSGDSERR